MAEYFEADWGPVANETETVFEPGHHYEWATLLYKYERVSGHDSASWRRRLNRKADAFGVNAETGFSINQLKSDGTWLNSRSRLWHQLERLRAQLIHPDQYPSSQTRALAAAIFDRYLNPGPVGGWIDELGSNGNVVSEKVPASMLYHAITSLGETL